MAGRSRRHLRTLARLAAALAILAAGASDGAPTSQGAGPSTTAPGPTAAPRGGLGVHAVVPPTTIGPSPAAKGPPGPTLGPITWDEQRGRYVAAWGEHLALLSLDAELQERLTQELSAGRVPWGATVVVEVKTGRVLALAEHSEREPDTPVARRALARAASVFKIVSSSALLRSGVPPEQGICTHGGRRRLAERHLVDNAAKDKSCLTFGDVLPYSANTAMARLVDKYVPVGGLLDEAHRWGFDAPLVFPLPVEPSPTSLVPEEPFARAQTAAGFGGVHLSALHAAMLAATVANHGVWVGPSLIDAVSGGPRVPVQEPTRVLDEPFARELANMMVDVVERGTARRAFDDRESPLRGVPVGGKTGTYMDYDQHIDITWFVGFAPADDPEVAVASVVVNDWILWWVKGLTVGRRALAIYWDERPHLQERALEEDLAVFALPATDPPSAPWLTDL